MSGTGRNCCARCGSSQQDIVPRAALPEAEILAFDDTTPVVMTPPATANVAEISVEGGSVRFTTNGVAPDNVTFRGHRQMDGARIELESLSEITNFKLIGLPGEVGTIYVEYFIVPLGIANS